MYQYSNQLLDDLKQCFEAVWIILLQTDVVLLMLESKLSSHQQ